MEDIPDYLRFHGIDASTTAGVRAVGPNVTDNVVAIAKASTRAASFDAPSEAAPGLVRKILEVEGIHRALEPDMQLGDLALGNCYERNAAKYKLLVQLGYVRLITGKPIESLGNDHVEPPGSGVFEQLLIAGSQC